METDMLDLMKIREEIDEVDRQLVSLYEKRIALASDVARYKIETGKKVKASDMCR